MKHLNEFFFNRAAIQVAQPVEIGQKAKIEELKNIKWEDIKILDPDENGDIFTMNFDLPLAKSIVFQIQLRPNGLYKAMNMEIAKELRGIGLGYKIFRAVLEEFGHLYDPASSRHNEVEIPKIIEKLSKDSKVEVIKKGKDNLIILKHNPNYKEIKDIFQA